MVLSRVNQPQDLKYLSEEELVLLAEEVRSEIIRATSTNGGHLASSLGAVELIIALHRVLDSPTDHILFDVGHQAYAHKILTGRKDLMHTVRTEGGLSGFTKISESEYDATTVGHASTSLASALGMALARDLFQQSFKIVVVIGDGALTGGMALAALNKIGELQKDMLIILNDNEMSISENVGALNRYSHSLQMQKWFQDAERLGRGILERVSPRLYEIADRAKEATKLVLHQENPFYAWNLRYVGPVDGHNLKSLIYTFEHLLKLEGPTILHVMTKKGKGYKVAEGDPIYWHGPSGFDLQHPEKAHKSHTWSAAFGQAVTELAELEPRLFVITPAMREGSGLVTFSETYPDRFLDTGITEDVAVTSAAGLALKGAKPIVAIYSTFLQRALDQVIHDVAIENLNVIFAVDRAGLVGADGATHQGVFDISYLRSVPNMQIAAPKDALELRAMMRAALEVGGPVAIRYPRGKTQPVPKGQWLEIDWGRWEVVKEGKTVYLLAFGKTLAYAQEAAGNDPEIGVVNARFIKPLDELTLGELVRTGVSLVTIEDHQLMAGFGSAVLESLNHMKLSPPLTRLGLPDHFTGPGRTGHQHAQYGIDAQGIRRVLADLGVIIV